MPAKQQAVKVERHGKNTLHTLIRYLQIMFHNYVTIIVGLILVFCSIIIYVYPPKFNNQFYGIRTRWTLKNEIVWDEGQKLFAVSIFAMGFIFLFLGYFKIFEKEHDFLFVLILLLLWRISKIIIHFMLARKFTEKLT